MIDYELWMYDREGEVETVLNILAESDDEAVQRARLYWHPYRMELREGERTILGLPGRMVGGRVPGRGTGQENFRSVPPSAREGVDARQAAS